MGAQARVWAHLPSQSYPSGSNAPGLGAPSQQARRGGGRWWYAFPGDDPSPQCGCDLEVFRELQLTQQRMGR